MHTSLIQAVRDLTAAVNGRDWRAALDRAADLLRQAGEAVFGEQHQQMAASAGHDELTGAVKELQAACKSAKPKGGRPKKGVAAAPVGKIGDGKILALITKLLPLILALLAK